MGLEGRKCLGDANREHASCVERLAQRLVIEAKVPRHRIDAEALWWLDAGNSPLNFVEKRQDIAGIARIPYGHTLRKDKAGSRVRRDPGLPPKLGGAIALAFEDGGDREIVGIDEFTVTEFLAVGELFGLLADVRMAAQRRVACLGYPLALAVAQRGRLGQQLLGLLPKCCNGLANLQKLPFGVTHKLHKDFPLPSALAAKAPHGFGQCLVELLGLTREDRGSAAALLRDVDDECQRFFWLYTGSWHQ